MRNTKESNLIDFLDKKFWEKCTKKVCKFAAKDFGKFSAVVAVLFSISIWITRSLGYFYMVGRFSVYNIDIGYIDVMTDNFLLQIVQSVAVCILLIVINCLYFYLSIQEDISKFGWKRKLKQLLFFTIEFVLINAWILITKRISPKDLLNELQYIHIEDGLVILGIYILTLIMINFGGIESIWLYKSYVNKEQVLNRSCEDVSKEKHKKKKGKNKGKKKGTKYLDLVKVILILLVTCVIEFGLMYFIGILEESRRTDFKFVEERVDVTIDDKYVFTSDGNEYSCYLYPVIYENEEVYILSRIFRAEDGLIIEHDFQKIIDKKDVCTYYVENLRIENNFWD